jgi:hypothetical protein
MKHVILTLMAFCILFGSVMAETTIQQDLKTVQSMVIQSSEQFDLLTVDEVYEVLKDQNSSFDLEALQAELNLYGIVVPKIEQDNQLMRPKLTPGGFAAVMFCASCLAYAYYCM